MEIQAALNMPCTHYPTVIGIDVYEAFRKAHHYMTGLESEFMRELCDIFHWDLDSMYEKYNLHMELF